ncbi:MAG: TonB family protein [Bdellovibrionales bacterium]|nr:TonB family protein [Bdellovibrionales bacterium]
MEALRPWQVSFLFHVGCALLIVGLSFLRIAPDEVYEIPIQVNEPKDIQNLTEIKEKPKVVLKSVNEAFPENKPTREIFGASRDSHTDEKVGAEGIDAKKGNTLAKEVDKTELLESDASSLPTPTEEYLVSEMPVPISEIRPVYPKIAKEKEIEGSVAMDVLIDEAGKVRQVSVIEGEEIFRTSAMEAMRKFLFRPAKVDGKSVAVRIRYAIKFKLEF